LLFERADQWLAESDSHAALDALVAIFMDHSMIRRRDTEMLWHQKLLGLRGFGGDAAAGLHQVKVNRRADGSRER
jgi:hypothetical protein